MPRVGFKPTITVFERAKIVQALNRAAIVIGNLHSYILVFNIQWSITGRREKNKEGKEKRNEATAKYVNKCI
jgi:hypothetical protein